MGGNLVSDFMDLSEEVADRFLHTVVVVDDEAVFGEKIVPPKDVKTPTRGGVQQDEPPDTETRRGTQHSLNAKEVIDSFALNGKVCSILKPESESELDLYKSVARRTDVFIIDWEILKDNGDIATEIIGKIIESDMTGEPRLRLILIYTGETDLDDISPKIQSKLRVYFNDSYTIDDDGVTLSKGYLRIAIYFKSRLNLDPQFHDRVISEEGLSQIVSSEFSKITAGLVSNLALESMSALRDNTHLILGKLGPKIDPPYLAHRALLPNPDDATTQAVDLISMEFHSLLEDYDVGRNVDLDAINAWLNLHKTSLISTVKVQTTDKSVTIGNMCDWQKHGLEQSRWFRSLDDEEKKDVKGKIHRHLTKSFSTSAEDPKEMDHRFAILSTLKSRYKNNTETQFLTLGTILMKDFENDNGDESYWLCVQPRCDSVRIDKDGRDFLFLKASKVGSGAKRFDLVVEFNERFQKLRINYEAHKTKKYKFKPKNDDESVIRGKLIEDNLIFESAGRVKLCWIAELKQEHAQRVANDFAYEISRVGLDESEWLRRSARK